MAGDLRRRVPREIVVSSRRSLAGGRQASLGGFLPPDLPVAVSGLLSGHLDDGVGRLGFLLDDLAVDFAGDVRLVQILLAALLARRQLLQRALEHRSRRDLRGGVNDSARKLVLGVDAHDDVGEMPPATGAARKVEKLLIFVILPDRRVLHRDLRNLGRLVGKLLPLFRGPHDLAATGLPRLTAVGDLGALCDRRPGEDHGRDELRLVGDLVVHEIALIRDVPRRHIPVDRLHRDGEARAGIAPQMLADPDVRDGHQLRKFHHLRHIAEFRGAGLHDRRRLAADASGDTVVLFVNREHVSHQFVPFGASSARTIASRTFCVWLYPPGCRPESSGVAALNPATQHSRSAMPSCQCSASSRRMRIVM